jgi:hypothetical protein
MNTLIKSFLLMGAIMFSQASQAAAYIDLGLGSAKLEDEIFGETVDGSDTYFKVAFGGQINDVVSIDGGLLDLGEAEETTENFIDVTSSADGLFGNVKIGTPGKVGVFGKVGLYLWDSKICLEADNPFFQDRCEEADGSDIFYGVGFRAGGFNLELLYMSLDDIDVNTVGASFTIPFGG